MEERALMGSTFQFSTPMRLPTLEAVGFRPWKAAAVELARSLCPAAGDFGLVGYLFADEEFAAYSGSSEGFHPTARPPSPGDKGAKEHLKLFVQEQEGLTLLRRAVLASLTPAVLQASPGFDPDYGATKVTLRDLLSFLQKRSTFSSPTLYENALENLARPLPPGSSVEEYLAAHRALHLECDRVGYPLNQGDKLRFLVRGVGGYEGPFATTLAVWEERVGQVPEQRTFEDGPLADPPSATHRGTLKKKAPQCEASSSTLVAPLVAYEGLASVLRRAALRVPRLASATAATFGTHALPTAQGETEVALATVAPAKQGWCWSHGACAHQGKDCKNPAKGHRPEATKQHPLGGPAPPRRR